MLARAGAALAAAGDPGPIRALRRVAGGAESSAVQLATARGRYFLKWRPDGRFAAEAAGRVAQDIPVNHSARFAPVIQPTLDTGTQALVVGALAWLAG